MALSACDDTSNPPRDEDLATVMGKTFALWNTLKSTIQDHIKKPGDLRDIEKIAAIKMAN